MEPCWKLPIEISGTFPVCGKLANADTRMIFCGPRITILILIPDRSTAIWKNRLSLEIRVSAIADRSRHRAR